MTHIINPKLTHRQKHTVIGTILGGSSIIQPSGGVNSYLSMRSKDSEWLQHKSNELNCLSSNKPFTIEKTNRWHSLCYPLFNEYRDIFYKDGKREITKNILESLYLSDLTFSIWCIDSWRYDRGRFVMNTHVWGESGTLEVVDYLKLLDMKSEIITDRGRFRIKLKQKSTREMMKIVSPHIPYFYTIRDNTPFR
jgi:hypothetical protein